MAAMGFPKLRLALTAAYCADARSAYSSLLRLQQQLSGSLALTAAAARSAARPYISLLTPHTAHHIKRVVGGLMDTHPVVNIHPERTSDAAFLCASRPCRSLCVLQHGTHGAIIRPNL